MQKPLRISLRQCAAQQSDCCATTSWRGWWDCWQGSLDVFGAVNCAASPGVRWIQSGVLLQLACLDCKENFIREFARKVTREIGSFVWQPRRKVTANDWKIVQFEPNDSASLGLPSAPVPSRACWCCRRRSTPSKSAPKLSWSRSLKASSRSPIHMFLICRETVTPTSFSRPPGPSPRSPLLESLISRALCNCPWSASTARPPRRQSS